MRLWTLHPKYLDSKGLVALWRESLLAQAVLMGRTKGYKSHPQLARFKNQARPVEALGLYLNGILAESKARGYTFSENRILTSCNEKSCITEAQGQLDYEWLHLLRKVQIRNPSWFDNIKNITSIDAHPIFSIIPGEIQHWENVR